MLSTRDMMNAPGLDPKRKYEGTVVDNNDPDHLARVRVSIKGVTDGIPNDKLPWVIPDFTAAAGSTANSGQFRVPKKGSSIGVKFQNGNPHYPSYSGLNITKKTMLPEALHNYPDRIVDLHPNGYILIVDTKSNEVFVRNPGDCHIFIQGKANITVVGDMNHKVSGNYNLEVGANLAMKIGGNVVMSAGGSLGLKGGSSATLTSGGPTEVGGGDLNLRGAHVGLNDPGAMPEVTDPPAIAAAAWPAVRGSTPK